MTDAGTLVDLVLVVLVVETFVLGLAGRRFPRLPKFRRLLPNLAAGLFLVMALRTFVHGGALASVGLFLALGGVAHVFDLRSRMRR